jgi:hypothetical protein
VLWDALMMYPHPGEPLHPVHDALSRLVLRDPEWRLQHDRYVREAIEGLLADEAWTRQVEAVADRLEPSVLRDRNKYGQVSPEPADVHRFSFAHWTHSLATLHDASKAYWQRVRTALDDVRADAVVHGNTVQVTLGGENAVRVSVQGDSLVGAPEVAGAAASITRSGTDAVHVTLMPRLLPPDSAHAGLHAPPRPAVVTITLPDGIVRSATIHPAE